MLVQNTEKQVPASILKPISFCGTPHFKGLEYRTYRLGLYFEGPELQFETDQSGLLSETPFQGGPLSLKLHFETDQFKSGTPFRSGLGISKIKQTFNFEGGLYSKFRKPVSNIKVWQFPRCFPGEYGLLKICSFRMPPERNNA
ncbi:hypothetical protein RCL_jg18814.t1 [Rhizophagus clarus]|uniref:Uncharacterized protein n=1 Tax=Rhizophagus clarus TaxID=94130 RepID=A0A8H3R2J0_9GLOM|nr:hypothetical protein RCL_jg18814.t1 [Rhizophagus clarus]